jgi:hypothetical protein
MSIKVIKKKYEHLIDDTVEVCLDSEPINYSIHIVYFISCICNKNWYDWLFNQMNLVKHMNGNIHIVASISHSEESEFREKIVQILPEANIECYYENEFEYRGIKKIWELGQIHSKENDILLYFHSKGVTHHSNYDSNRHANYNAILKDIDKIKEIFTIFPKIDKIGESVGGIGWLWYNFWYVRGSYLSKVEEPVKTERRHYYEDYISRKVKEGDDIHCQFQRPFSFYENTIKNCYGFYTGINGIKNINSFYCPGENRYFNI